MKMPLSVAYYFSHFCTQLAIQYRHEFRWLWLWLCFASLSARALLKMSLKSASGSPPVAVVALELLLAVFGIVEVLGAPSLLPLISKSPSSSFSSRALLEPTAVVALGLAFAVDADVVKVLVVRAGAVLLVGEGTRSL